MSEELLAPAKLTLSLRITGVRDDGLHTIDAEMDSLDLCDRLVITEGESGIVVDGPFAHGVPTGGRNLTARALRLVDRHAGVHITKQIPSGGGLGGGSSDAAAVLRWAGVNDPAVAARLGADVAFCLVGGRARVSGIGDVVESLPAAPRGVTLVIPPLHVSTAAAYAAWDELGGPRAVGLNDLEPAALVVEPRLRYWRDRIVDLTGQTPGLAGSGATWWLDGHDADALHELGDEGATILCVTTQIDGRSVT